MTGEFFGVLFVGLFCVFVGFIVWLAICTSRQNISKLKMILPEVGEIDFHLHPSGTANYSGQKYHYLFYAGSKNSPRRLSVSIEVSCRAQFAILKETKTDVFFKKMGINHEVQTGDADFDEKYYILSDHTELVLTTLREKSIRDAVRLIFETGFTEVQLKDGRLDATWRGFNFPETTQSEAIARVIEALGQVSKNIPPQAFDGALSKPVFQLGFWLRCLAHAFPYFLGIVGFVYLVLADLPLDAYAFFLKSLLVSLPSLAGVVLLIANFFRGRPSSGREVMAFFFAGIFCFPLFFHGLGVYLNCKNDRSSVIHHEVLVAAKKIEKSKSSTSYYMSVNSWRQSRGFERLRVSQEFFSQIEPGKTRVEIASRAGALRHEWVESYSVLDF